jgi:hypothetical protein
MVKLYSISGIEVEPVSDRVIPFGGYFFIEDENEMDFFRKSRKLPLSDILENECPSDILGQIVDECGVSNIQGHFIDSHFYKYLYVEKSLSGKPMITYKFNFTKENNLWIGDYKKPGVEKGKAFCKVNESVNLSDIMNQKSLFYDSNVIRDFV